VRSSHIAVVPAAGEARRLPPALRPKELLTVGDAGGTDGRRPRAVSEYLFEALVAADVQRVCVVIAPEKRGIPEFYGSGARHGVQITYVSQSQPTGMADAIDAAYPLTGNATVLMGMPDTIFRPVNAFARLRLLCDREQADLALGVFPTDEAGRLGPVLFDRRGAVSEVFDKPDPCPVNNTWGIACWGAAFTEFLHADLASWPRAHGERHLGSVFDAAIEHGLRVRAVSFDEGIYIDVGTVSGLCAARRAVEHGAKDRHPW
jgi:glucose-1-phosphate thymidylyltransferase